ncbi:MAG TPA: iron donor protein CyaY [Rhodocyclaceae bacterium]
MDDKEFDQRANETLEWIDGALESCGIDLDLNQLAGGVLEVEFPDGSQLIINRHAAAREIWVAARSGGFHFRFDGTDWVDTRSGERLVAALSRLVSLQAQQPVALE